MRNSTKRLLREFNARSLEMNYVIKMLNEKKEGNK
jgi:hypothetical protein